MTNENLQATCFEHRPSLKEKIARKLFNSEDLELPKAPPHFADVLHFQAEVRWTLVERVKILFSGRTACRAKIVCQNVVGETLPNSVAYVLPPKWMDA